MRRRLDRHQRAGDDLPADHRWSRFYLGFHARKISESGGRPEDRKDGEIAEGAGELGFFPPYSWWPLWCALCLAAMVLGVAVGWWLFIIGGVLGAVALCGLIFEYYRGEHAH